MAENPKDPGKPWAAIDELADLKRQRFEHTLLIGKEPDLEACLRRVLRPHDEAGFESPRDDWMIKLRSDLDGDLDALTLHEIRNQLGLPNDALPAPTLGKLQILFRSEAFLRYVNAYLYFGIRFLASRDRFSSAANLPVCADANVRSLPLKFPPPVGGNSNMERFQSFHELPYGAPIDDALDFLDAVRSEHEQAVQYQLQEPSEYELWLRGLRPEIEEESPQGKRFRAITDGLSQWATTRSDFYLELSRQPTAFILQGEIGVGEQNISKPEKRPVEGWLVKHPAAARLALADVYWIARLLRADVSENATVTYQKVSWVHLLRFRAILSNDPDQADKLKKAEDGIRSVFDFVCDLIQNAVDLTRDDDRPRGEAGKAPVPSAKWRTVFDEELDEIDRQRRIRHFLDPSLPADWSKSGGPAGASSEVAEGGIRENLPPMQNQPPANSMGWSKRMTTGDRPRCLIGLAFSGGGIRSATFNLGVLQGLQELDLLRHVDYLSTVSGGGFIGSWLVANVRRSAYWLGRLTDWSDSIAHLRSHSNYLAPRTGILSADTWNLANSWFRNAFLIQLTGLAWLFVLLLGTLGCLRAFLILGSRSVGGFPLAGIVAFSLGVVLTFTALFNLAGTNSATVSRLRRLTWVLLLAGTPVWIGAFAFASLLRANAGVHAQGWASLAGLCDYSKLFFAAWRPWRFLLSSTGAALLVIAFVTQKRWHKLNALWISPFCTFVLYLELVAIFWVLRYWSRCSAFDELAFVFGPFLVLMAFSACVLLVIGFTGRNTEDGLREWWTRFGTWLTIFSGAGLFLASVAVFGPWLILQLSEPSSGNWVRGIKWTSVLGWLGTVVGGLFAGKSSRTSGEGQSGNAPALEVLAKIGGFLFILGSFLLGSTLLYLLMFELFVEKSIDPKTCFRVLGEFHHWEIPKAFFLALALGSCFSWFFDINIFGLNQFYRNRLVRCYLGATRWIPGLRSPNPFTKFDFQDDLKLSRLRTDSPGENQPGGECDPYRGPFPIVNCTLNLGGSTDLALNTRRSASFMLTPLRCGCDRPTVGYAPTWTKKDGKDVFFAGGVQLGQAVAISGAAVSSNMGYNTSPLVAFLLTMFNVRLGWWFPNPGQRAWSRRGLKISLYYLVMELLGIADDKRFYLNTSDGGHFENLGIYELIRRRCKLIIACDAECDEELQFGGLGKLIRICQTDFGAVINIDVKSIRLQNDGPSLAHCAVGEIKYGSGEIGLLVYLKASMTGDEDVSITQYRSSHPSFPHETTANQFFSEDQFESYRKLGLHIVRSSFKGNVAGDDPLMIAAKMADVLTPAGCTSQAFLKHSQSLERMWEKFRASQTLLPFMEELVTLAAVTPRVRPKKLENDELCIGMELIQLMEDVFLDLRLDDFWDHPDNRGWAILFMRWARSPRFRMVWEETRRTFGIRFEYFCNARLGLQHDQPIVRV